MLAAKNNYAETLADNVDNQRNILHPYKNGQNSQPDKLDTLKEYYTQTDGLNKQTNSVHGERD